MTDAIADVEIEELRWMLRQVQHWFHHKHRRPELETVCPRCLTLQQIARVLPVSGPPQGEENGG